MVRRKIDRVVEQTAPQIETAKGTVRGLIRKICAGAHIDSLQKFEDFMILALAVFWLFVLIAVAIVALGYGIRAEDSVRRAGKSRHLFRRNSQLTDSRHTDELHPPDNHSH